MLEFRKRAPSLSKFQFDSEQSCVRHLLQVRWPDGFICPHCASRDACRMETRRLPLFQCRRCRHQTSLLAGTIMEGSRTSLLKWYTAMFLLARTGVGTTAVHLSKTIRVTYKTAWLMLHKIRHALSEADSAVRLSGAVRINRDVYGRPVYYRATHHHPKEQPLFTGGTVDNEGEALYIKMKLISSEHIHRLHVKPSADITFINAHTEMEADETIFFPRRLTPRRFPSLARCYRWAQGWIRHTFKGIGRKYVQNYLNEFCYCYNAEQTGASPFERLPGNCSAYDTVTLASLRARLAV